MARKLKRIDISDIPELLSIVEEVRNSGEARVLGRNGEDLAVIRPVEPALRPRLRRARTKADYEAFRSAAGGWKDLDTDGLITDIYADRRGSNRPATEL